jgi:chemotaxis protein MotA
MSAVKATLKGFPACFKGTKYSKDTYMELMALLYELLGKVRKEGLMSIEGDVERPNESPIFAKYPKILSDHHVVEFITDYLRIMVSGNLNAMEIENLMDMEIETHHHEAMLPSHTIAKLGDGMPAFGIVAAVMGVVHTMESVGIPPAELGMLIAHALVGTFLGILLAYGFVGPLAGLLEQKAEESTKMFQTIKVTLLANLNGYAPAMAVEFGRKVLVSTDRPGFTELEEHVKQKR